MARIDDQIADIQKKLDDLKTKKEQIEARKVAALIKSSRAEDTRRKILVGAAILNKVARGEWPEEKLLALIEPSLTRDDDRLLFKLPPLATTPEKPAAAAPALNVAPAPRLQATGT